MRARGIIATTLLVTAGVDIEAQQLRESRSPPALSAEHVAERMAGVPLLRDVRLSPDGAWVVYELTRRSVVTNELKTEHLLQRVPHDGEALAEPVSLSRDAGAVQWCPDTRCLSMILDEADGAEGATPESGFARYDVATGTLTPIPVRDTARAAGSPGSRPRVTRMSERYAWSPRGTYVAFTAPLAERGALDPRRGVPHGSAQRGAPTGLFLLDNETGIVRQLTPDSLNVARFGGFDWAPDERSLAVTIDHELNSQGKNTDLVVIDVATRMVRPLVMRPAMDKTPRWSPDGRWIAFSSHYEEASYRAGWPALVPAEGGTIVSFPRPRSPQGAPGWWSRDSRAFYYESWQGMTRTLVRADTATRTTMLPLITDLRLAYEDNRSVSADGRRLAFTRESVSTPPELFVVELDTEGRADGVPRQLTDLNDDFEIGRRVRTDTLSWPSPDGRFNIHALLLTPASAYPSDTLAGPLPTLVQFMGGPSMVVRGFATHGWSGVGLALAARGYAVLVPNTRGRNGFGPEFENTIRNDKNRARDPLADALAGLDLLIARGTADPDQNGVLGFSYGGSLTAYTITQTNRFKAAVIHEGGRANLTTFFGVPAGGWRSLAVRDLFGVHNPFDSAERARLIEESPGLNAHRVRTPTLLIYGARQNMEASGRPFFHALRRFNVPVALFGYDEGHVFVRPSAIADNLTRTAEWLDYWVRGIPFTDRVRAAEYGEREWRRH